MDTPIIPAVIPPVVPPAVHDIVPPVIPAPILIPNSKISTTNVVLISVAVLVIVGIIVYKYKTAQNNAAT